MATLKVHTYQNPVYCSASEFCVTAESENESTLNPLLSGYIFIKGQYKFPKKLWIIFVTNFPK